MAPVILVEPSGVEQVDVCGRDVRGADDEGVFVCFGEGDAGYFEFFVGLYVRSVKGASRRA